MILQEYMRQSRFWQLRFEHQSGRCDMMQELTEAVPWWRMIKTARYFHLWSNEIRKLKMINAHMKFLFKLIELEYDRQFG